MDTQGCLILFACMINFVTVSARVPWSAQTEQAGDRELFLVSNSELARAKSFLLKKERVFSQQKALFSEQQSLQYCLVIRERCKFEFWIRHRLFIVVFAGVRGFQRHA